jgi:hypothetical protein
LIKIFRKLFLGLTAGFLCMHSVHSQELPAQKLTTDKWIKTWLLCGPVPLEAPSGNDKVAGHFNGFETDYLKKYGGEQNLKVKVGDEIAFAGGSAKWKLYTTPDSVVDLRQTISRNAPVFAYAYTEIQSDLDKTYFVSLGSNDGGALWVNGVHAWDYGAVRGLRVDHDVIPVHFKKGKNTILLKVEQGGNRWEFCMRLRSFSKEKLAQRANIFSVKSTQNGDVRIESPYTVSIQNQLVKSVELEVLNARDQVVISEKRTAAFQAPIRLKTTDYQTYQAHYDVVLKSGEKIHQHQTFNAGKRQEFVLFKNRTTDYTIVLADHASESEKWAAEELKHWLKEVSGAEFPIKPLSSSTGPRIILGYNQEVARLTGMPAPADLDEAYHYSNMGQDLVIFGGKQRGTMYGVMSFLENELACRWYTSTVSSIPKRSEVKFTNFGHSEKPGIRVRNDFYFEAFDPTWAARNKMNGSMGAPKQPGGVESYWSVHTFYPLVPPAEFFDKHPEYYSVLNGKRVPELAQLCLSNPDVLEIIKDRIKKRMRESPEYLIYDVSQNDYYNPCECDKCQAIVKREGSESGIMIWFVNQVAESVAKEFPDKFIGTLAYQYTRNPPKSIRPRENVVVRFCSIECCFAHDFKSCPENKSFMKDMATWSQMAPHIYIWDYAVNFGHYLMPYPNFAVLQPNIKAFQENKAIGIMEQAAYQSRGGEFAELRSYLISRLLWNPDCDTKAVIDDFMYGYYGRSGKFVKQYFDLLQSQVTPETHIGLSTDPANRLFSDEFVSQSAGIFDEALKAAENDDMVRRVEMASLPILYLKCKRTPDIAHYDGSYKKLCEIIDREKITHFAEGGEVENFHKEMKVK